MVLENSDVLHRPGSRRHYPDLDVVAWLREIPVDEGFIPIRIPAIEVAERSELNDRVALGRPVLHYNSA